MQIARNFYSCCCLCSRFEKALAFQQCNKVNQTLSSTACANKKVTYSVYSMYMTLYVGYSPVDILCILQAHINRTWGRYLINICTDEHNQLHQQTHRFQKVQSAHFSVLPLVKENDDSSFTLNLRNRPSSKLLMLNKTTQTRAGVQSSNHCQHSKHWAMDSNIFLKLIRKQMKKIL